MSNLDNIQHKQVLNPNDTREHSVQTVLNPNNVVVVFSCFRNLSCLRRQKNRALIRGHDKVS